MMLQRNFRRVLDLRRGSAERGAKPRGSHGGGRPHLPLTADLGARNGRAVLDQPPDCGGGQQEITFALSGRAVAMVAVIAQDCRRHARGAIGRRGDDLAARGVFLIHRHGVDAEPVVGDMRLGDVQTLLRLKLVMDALRPALHAETAGQHALLGETPVDNGVHRSGDGVDPLVQLRRRQVGFLIRPLHLGDGLA